MNLTGEHTFNLQPGAVIAGRFEILKALGSGSMGLVYACRDREFSGRILAVKVLFPEVANDQVSMARFRNEIVASYKVSHPNVIRSFELVRDNDLIAYTMEHIDGGTLLEFISADKLIDINFAIKLMIQMCAGVQAIHDAGIVHRDLKPENILLTNDNSVKIADFGIARTAHGPKLTEHGGVVGTIDYVSPEYILESKVDWRSDIYALGVLSYELVTGQAPFRGDSVYSTMTKRLNEDPAPPSTIRAECPIELDRIILKALARKIDDRYQSAAIMATDLVKIYREDQNSPLSINSTALINSDPAKFKGPSLDQESVEALAPSLPELSSESDSAASPKRTRQRTDSHVKINFQPVNSASEADINNLNQLNLAKTATIEPGVIDIAAYYHNRVNDNSKLESVIERTSYRSHQSAPMTHSESVQINTGSISQERLRMLNRTSFSSKLRNQFQRLLLLFIASLAIVLGVASGYYLINFLFGPEDIFQVLESLIVRMTKIVGL